MLLARPTSSARSIQHAVCCIVAMRTPVSMDDKAVPGDSGSTDEPIAAPRAGVKCSPTTCAAKACSSTAMAVLAGTGWSAALACCAGLGKQTQPWTSSPGPSPAVLASRGVWATHNSRTCMEGLVVALMKTAGAAHKSPRNSWLHGLSSRRAQALSITGEAAANLTCNMAGGGNSQCYAASTP